MAALTNEQQTAVLQLAQAMFDATPGAVYLDVLGGQLAAGQPLAGIAQSLTGNALFLGKNYSVDLTPQAFAEALVNDLLGDLVPAENKTIATDYIVGRMKDGANQNEIIAEATGILASFSTDDENWGEAVLEYHSGNAEKIVDNLVGDTVTAGDKADAVNYMISQIALGQTFGSMVVWAMQALDGIGHDHPVWGDAASRFDNRIEVSHYYSINKSGSATSLGTLQQLLSGVTADAATVAAAKAAIDDSLNGEGFSLTSLNGANGFRIDGVLGSDNTGFAANGAGDVNGDGFDDFIVGAPHNFDSLYSGSSSVIFGKASGFDATLLLSGLNGTNGFRLNGVAGGDAAGNAVSSAGDINKDGFDDLLIGAPISDVPANDTGYTYVVFGKASGFSATMDLSSLDGSNGFRLDGTVESLTGWSLAHGDVNNDGFDDMVVGAPNSDLEGINKGSGLVVFGKASGFAATLSSSSLDGTTGFRVDGLAEGEFLGNGVGAGDINGDGFDDVVFGAYYASANGDTSGSSYVVFGKASGFGAVVDLSGLDGSNGFRIDGAAEGDQSGYSISVSGDVNGDGFADIIIGAPYAKTGNGEDTGAGYVVFGKASGFGATLDLSSLDGTNGFSLAGGTDGDYAGKFVSSAGDFNGDGFDDVIIGSYGADANGVDSGACYVVFGKASGFDASINLTELSASTGLIINGIAETDGLGRAVNGAGDINDDGFDDLIIGAPFGDGAVFNSGTAYVLFGHSTAGG